MVGVHRMMGIAAALAGLMTLLTIPAGGLMAMPAAFAFAVTAFWWYVTRPAMALVTNEGLCSGCLRGCVECRERITA